MCIRDRVNGADYLEVKWRLLWLRTNHPDAVIETEMMSHQAVSYTHLRAHETVLDLVCRLLLEKKNKNNIHSFHPAITHQPITHSTPYIRPPLDPYKLPTLLSHT